MFLVPTNEKRKCGKAEWESWRVGVGRKPIILLQAKVPMSGPVRRSRRVHAQGGNSPAPATLLKKPLCRAHVGEEMSEENPGKGSRKVVRCRITLCSMRRSGRSFFCFC